MNGSQPFDKDRQAGSALPTRIVLHENQRRARLLAMRIQNQSASLAEVRELADLVVALTADVARGGS